MICLFRYCEIALPKTLLKIAFSVRVTSILVRLISLLRVNLDPIGNT